MATEEALRAALAAPGGPLPALRESHGAWVVLTRDRAYKLKKPVRFAFLDYSTPQARRASCEEEARVNGVLAPDLVLGVRGLRAAGDGVELCDADDGDAFDWVVEMRRFDEDRTMAALLERDELTVDHVRAAAGRLAGFHATAEVVQDPDPAGRVRAAMMVNLDELREAREERPGDGPVSALGSFLLGSVLARREELSARGTAGLVRDGHGDLRAEHVVFEDSGVLVVDRLEFDPQLRRIDVADDLSFLAMDLEARGSRAYAGLLVEDYREAGGCPGDPALVALFAAHHALVRAKVALLRGLQDPGAGLQAEAARLLALAARLAWRACGPLAVLVHGPPASGKSTLAAAIAKRSGLPVLSSDRFRKEGPGRVAYTPGARAAVYGELGRRARAALDRGDGVIVDATFGDPALRAAFLGELAPPQRALVYAVRCQAPLPVLAARAAQPRRGASDAGPRVAERLARSFQPVTELEPAHVTAVDATQPAARQVADVESWLAGARR